MGGLFAKKKGRIIIVGLDNSGKTTLINSLKPKKDSSEDIVPTVGYSIDHFKKNKVHFTVFDMSGQGKYRDLWEQYYEKAEACIFVVDSSDKLRMAVAKHELELMLNHSAIAARPIPILFFANKMDIPTSLDESDVSRELKLELITDRSWNIFASNALSGQGVTEGINWLTDKLTVSQKK